MAPWKISGTYFDVPDAMKTMECTEQEDGTGGIYYTNPTDDFSGPGACGGPSPRASLISSRGRKRPPCSTRAYPATLQLGLATYLRDELNPGAATAAGPPGTARAGPRRRTAHGRTRLPGRSGRSHGRARFPCARAARVVVDLGVHLGKHAGVYGDGAWDHDSAWKFLRENVAMEENFSFSNWTATSAGPVQPSPYKIGQRIWNELREEARLVPRPPAWSLT